MVRNEMKWGIWTAWWFLFSVRYFQDYIKHMIKNIHHKTFPTNRPVHIYINRLVFNIKDGYKLELQMPELMKLFESTKKLIDTPTKG